MSPRRRRRAQPTMNDDGRRVSGVCAKSSRGKSILPAANDGTSGSRGFFSFIRRLRRRCRRWCSCRYCRRDRRRGVDGGTRCSTTVASRGMVGIGLAVVRERSCRYAAQNAGERKRRHPPTRNSHRPGLPGVTVVFPYTRTHTPTLAGLSATIYIVVVVVIVPEEDPLLSFPSYLPLSKCMRIISYNVTGIVTWVNVKVHDVKYIF